MRKRYASNVYDVRKSTDALKEEETRPCKTQSHPTLLTFLLFRLESNQSFHSLSLSLSVVYCVKRFADVLSVCLSVCLRVYIQSDVNVANKEMKKIKKRITSS